MTDTVKKIWIDCETCGRTHEDKPETDCRAFEVCEQCGDAYLAGQVLREHEVMCDGSPVSGDFSKQALFKLSDFIADNRISMTTERVDRDPNMDETAAGSMDHWKVVLTRRAEYDSLTGRRYAPFSRALPAGKVKARMTTYFSMGFGHHGAEPKTEEVLDCLASDAHGALDPSFEDWCSECGYDPDSRKAEKTWRAVRHASARLKRFLGDDLFETLLYKTERL